MLYPLKDFSLFRKDFPPAYESVPIQINTRKMKRFRSSIMKISLPTTLASAALLAAVLNSHAQAPYLTEVLALDHASADDVLASPFASGELLFTARTTEWGRSVLAADITTAPPVVRPLESQLGNGPY